MFEVEVTLAVQAAIAEYMASCSRHGIAVPAGLHLLSVEVALLRGHKHQVSLALTLFDHQSSAAICWP